MHGSGRLPYPDMIIFSFRRHCGEKGEKGDLGESQATLGYRCSARHVRRVPAGADR
jgi:hypothetical protein